MQARTVTTVVASVAVDDAGVAALDDSDGAARPLTAVIVGGGLGGLAVCRARQTVIIVTPSLIPTWTPMAGEQSSDISTLPDDVRHRLLS
jgi:hypothetical protein